MSGCDCDHDPHKDGCPALTCEHPIDMAALGATARAAYDEVVRLCDPSTTWRMSIPANPERDSDLLIAAALTEIPDMVERVRAAEAALARGKALADWIFAELLAAGAAGREPTTFERNVHTELRAALATPADESGQ